jgi:[ribosomal protein S5]-alanine N-acetyltransferase
MHEPMLTERLRLRPFRPGDLDALHALWSDPEVGRWVGGTHTDLRESEEELGEHLRHQEQHGFSLWAVEERATGELVGEIGLQRFEGRGPEVEIGWAVTAAARGRGYATVIAVVLPDNLASRRICERLGMRAAGMREAYGHEHVLYELSAAARTPPAAASSGSRR